MKGCAGASDAIARLLRSVHAELDENLHWLLREVEQQIVEANPKPQSGEVPLVASRCEVDSTTWVITRLPGKSTLRLTSRKKQITRLVAAGLQNKEIAERLAIRPATVASHLQRIFGKLQINSRASLAQHALLNT